MIMTTRTTRITPPIVDALSSIHVSASFASMYISESQFVAVCCSLLPFLFLWKEILFKLDLALLNLFDNRYKFIVVLEIVCLPLPGYLQIWSQWNLLFHLLFVLQEKPLYCLGECPFGVQRHRFGIRLLVVKWYFYSH